MTSQDEHAGERGFYFDEKYLSQIPALQVLVNLGYRYLTPAGALAARGGRAGNVLLEEILREQLKKLNRIQHKGGSHLFSEKNILSTIQRLKNVKYDGLLKTNEAVYDLLKLGVALEQSIEGPVKRFTLNYVDWRNPANNVYHVAAEFAVERTRSVETCRPDIVQTAIARYLNALRQEIDLLGQSVATLKTQKCGLMQKLLTSQWRLPIFPGGEHHE